MATTTTAYRFTVTSIPDLTSDGESLKELADGMHNAVSGLHKSDIEALFDYAEANATAERDAVDIAEPYLQTWEGEVVQAAIAEVAPEAARMLTEAINRRLPWTWDPDR